MAPAADTTSATLAGGQRPINPEEIAMSNALPSIATASIGDVKTTGLPVPGVPVKVNREVVPSLNPRRLRIGDRVRSFVDDVCVTIGLEGLVVNVAPPRYGAPARARILWDNETVSMADVNTFEWIDPSRSESESA